MQSQSVVGITQRAVDDPSESVGSPAAPRLVAFAEGLGKRGMGHAQQGLRQPAQTGLVAVCPSRSASARNYSPLMRAPRSWSRTWTGKLRQIANSVSLPMTRGS